MSSSFAESSASGENVPESKLKHALDVFRSWDDAKDFDKRSTNLRQLYSGKEIEGISSVDLVSTLELLLKGTPETPGTAGRKRYTYESILDVINNARIISDKLELSRPDVVQETPAGDPPPPSSPSSDSNASASDTCLCLPSFCKRPKKPEVSNTAQEGSHEAPNSDAAIESYQAGQSTVIDELEILLDNNVGILESLLDSLSTAREDCEY